MHARPLIGVTTSEVRLLAHAQPLPEGDPPQPEMVLGLAYAGAVERAGGLPVVLPPTAPEAVVPLDAFELAVARAADARAIPVLGICRGCQALNVARGGSLHQHLPDVTDGSIDHRQTASGRETTHEVRVEPGSRLAGIVGEELRVNSFHHQAIDRLGSDLRAVAWAPDGVVEGIEGTGSALYLGVQWHVETLVERRAHAALFDALVAEAVRHVSATAQRAA